jgi:acetyl-CoA carboxylase carboxyltransferase component
VADVEPTDDPARPVAADELTGLALVKALADNGVVIDLYESFAPEMTTALCAIGGRTCGVIATDASAEDGKLTAKGARKAARMVSFCDAFSIPVVTLVDSVGVDNSSPREPAPVFGKLAKAYATATTAKISVVVGNAYGAAFTLLGSRALGADLALALPETVISVLPPEVAVAFLMNDQITQDKPREAVEAEWMETVASPVAAAESGDIDDIIPAYELRARLSSALYMLAEKADTTPDRKHGVPTL